MADGAKLNEVASFLACGVKSGVYSKIMPGREVLHPTVMKDLYGLYPGLTVIHHGEMTGRKAALAECCPTYRRKENPGLA